MTIDTAKIRQHGTKCQDRRGRAGIDVARGSDPAATAIETLRYALIMALLGVLTWIVVGAFLGTTTPAADLFANASLCMHRPGN